MLKIEWLEVGGNEKPSSRHASSKKHIKIRDKIVVIRHLTHFLTLKKKGGIPPTKWFKRQSFKSLLFGNF